MRFSLNNLGKVRPTSQKTHAGERYIGPVFDESGVQFYLFYNKAQKVFHYVLNQ